MEGSRKSVWSWIIHRVTAVFLVVGLIVHFIVLHYGIERPVNFAKVYQRLSHPAWIIFDSLLLIAVIYHALYGAYSIISDYNPGRSSKRILSWAFWLIGIATFFVSFFILIPYGQYGLSF